MKVRALVFGATGTGKTSLCNALTGSTRPTDSGALGVTQKSHLYGAFRDGDVSIEMVDTVGLRESSHGTVPAEQAVLDLVELLKKSRAGFSLLVQVTRASRITKDHDEDYDFFVNKMTQQKIPVVLAVRGCENEEPMSAWVDNNKAAFARFLYKEVIPCCFASGGALESFYAELRAASREATLNAIREHSTPRPVLLFGPGSGATFNEALSRIWNEFVSMAGLPEKYRRKVNESAYDLLKRVGVPKKVADATAQHIPELLEELGNKAPIPGAGRALKWVSRHALLKLLGKKP